MKLNLTALIACLLVIGTVPSVRSQYGEEYGAGYGDEYGYGDGEGYGGYEEEGGEVDEADVVVLTAENFEDLVMKAEFALVEFYAPWCGHCKNLAPQYAAAATALKKEASGVIIGKVDATVEEELAGRFEIQGYPTLKWFVNGQDMEYDGPRDADGITSWVKKKSGPPAPTIETVEAAEEFFEKKSGVFAVFDAFEGDKWEVFQEVAKNEGKVEFAQTTSKEVAAAMGVKSLTFLRDFDDGNVEYDGDWSGVSLKDFVNSHKLPRVIPFNEQNAPSIFEAGIPHQVILFASSDILEETTKVASTVSKLYAGKIIFVSVDTDDKETQQVLEFFSIDPSQTETAAKVMGFLGEVGTKYKLTEEFSVETLTAFCEDFLADKLEPYLKSAEPPEENDGPVTIIVGKTFDAIAKDTTKDVLVEVYAPWCGHCKKLVPVYNKLGKRFQKIDSVVIAKMDGTENEHPDVQIEGFPSFFFFPAGEDSEAIEVGEETERTLAGLTKFIKANAKIPYELPKKKAAPKIDEESESGESHDEL